MDDENTTARESEFCRSRKCEWDSLCCGRSEIGIERTGFPSVWIRSVLQVRGRPHYLRVQTSALTPRCTLDSWQPIATLERPICRIPEPLSSTPAFGIDTNLCSYIA